MRTAECECGLAHLCTRRQPAVDQLEVLGFLVSVDLSRMCVFAAGGHGAGGRTL
jgi:hypothetical protein